MKKIFALLFAICIIVLLNKCGVKAAPSADQLKNFYDENYLTITNISIDLSKWQDFVNGAYDYGTSDKYYMGLNTTTNQICVIGCTSEQSAGIASNYYYVTPGNGYFWQWYASDNPAQTNSYSTSVTSRGNLLLNEVVNTVDWDNIIYDPMIPTPNFSVTYTQDTSTLPRFPLEVGLNNSNSDYFVEIVMENMTPSFVGVKPDGTYEAFQYRQFPSNIIYSKESQTVSTDVTAQLLSAQLSSAWRSDILSYDNTQDNAFYIAVSDSPTFYQSTQYTFLCGLYDSYRQIACFYGNNTGISMRYLRVVDGVAYAGKVKSWTNLYGGTFSESLPDYYKPYETAQGYETTGTEIIPVETTSPYVDAPNNQFGTKTGLTININTGNSVPNYPNYPTIATYNLDNMLVKTMDQGEHIGGFLTGIVGFAGAALAFIPDYVWQVVAFGFSLSIVVMFLKIL